MNTSYIQFRLNITSLFTALLLVVFTSSLSAQNSGAFILSGNISSIGGKSGTQVKITLTSNSESLETLSDTDGNYQISLQSDNIYRIDLEKNTTYLNGLSTFDLVGGQRAILGIDDANCYKAYAMDLNNDQQLRATDLLEFRKRLLGIYAIYRDKFHFLPPLAFLNQSNTVCIFDAQVDEYYFVYSTGNEVIKDFVIIKKGDINDSADY